MSPQKIVNAKPHRKIVNTYIDIETLDNISRILEDCSHFQRLNKAELIRDALDRGLTQIEQELKAQAIKKPV